MNRAELLEILAQGENSGIEFKRDDVAPQDLAKELVAFANFEGGRIFLGVEDTGVPTGITRDRLEEWVMQVCRDKVKPEIVPFYETMPLENGQIVAVVQIIRGLDVHHLWHHNHRYYYLRVGTTSREASPEELRRLFHHRGLIRFDLHPVPGASLVDLDLERLKNYLGYIRNQDVPSKDNIKKWEVLLINTEIMVEDQERALPSVGGLVLFGQNPNRFLPMAGISAVAYPTKEKDYAAVERATIRGPAVPLFGKNKRIVETGLIEQALEFVRRNMGVVAWIDAGGRRRQKSAYPIAAVREALVNAIVHRDYSITGTDIELSLYEDRLEVISPGRLVNTITVDRMKAGCRSTRNELIKEVMRDYGYLEHMGMGIPRKIIRGMLEHNGTEPDLIPREEDFILRLWKEQQTS